ncbi:MAG TPA: hypothetical protein VEB20_02940 [Azospirillaceae bacterium]|nr:hypothetical protein [Azospirillaceae bacterium]
MNRIAAFAAALIAIQASAAYATAAQASYVEAAATGAPALEGGTLFATPFQASVLSVQAGAHAVGDAALRARVQALVAEAEAAAEAGDQAKADGIAAVAVGLVWDALQRQGARTAG